MYAKALIYIIMYYKNKLYNSQAELFYLKFKTTIYIIFSGLLSGVI